MISKHYLTWCVVFQSISMLKLKMDCPAAYLVILLYALSHPAHVAWLRRCIRAVFDFDIFDSASPCCTKSTPSQDR